MEESFSVKNNTHQLETTSALGAFFFMDSIPFSIAESEE
jgi:hypothetical protein